MPDLTIERLKELLSYDPDTGNFYWLITKGRAKTGRVAGSKDLHGYVAIFIDGKLYKAHRLAWFYTYGKWPDGDLDHKNLDRADNAIENLREATESQNSGNSPRRKDNTTGFKGVTFSRTTQKRFIAQIMVQGHNHGLGYFDTAEEAHAAYCAAAYKYFGEFARTE